MRVCFVTNQLFAWGVYGGYGFLTRLIGSELVKRGVEVFVLMPRMVSKGQRAIENLDGMTVIGIHTKHLWQLRPLLVNYLYRICEADIYHSQEASSDSYFTMKLNPHAKHILTFQDPRTPRDYIQFEGLNQGHRRLRNRISYILNMEFEHSCRKKFIHRTDAIFCQAKYIIPKVTSLFGLNRKSEFLPNPVRIPEGRIRKASTPTVCFLGRFDDIKRPKLFFQLAKSFPEVEFIALGKAHDEVKDRYLRKKYSNLSNLEMPGLKLGEEKLKVLERSWILVNTSVHECLPFSFLEAAAYRCSILSAHNPDGFAENFGYHVMNGEYVYGLKYLLENDRWKEKGEKAYEYVKEVHDLDKVITQHINVYKRILES